MGDDIAPPAAPIAISGYNKPPIAARRPNLIAGISPHLNRHRNKEDMAEPAPGWAAFSQ